MTPAERREAIFANALPGKVKRGRKTIAFRAVITRGGPDSSGNYGRGIVVDTLASEAELTEGETIEVAGVSYVVEMRTNACAHVWQWRIKES